MQESIRKANLYFMLILAFFSVLAVTVVYVLGLTTLALAVLIFNVALGTIIGKLVENYILAKDKKLFKEKMEALEKKINESDK